MTKFKVLSTKKLNPLLVSESAERGIEIIEKEFITILPVTNGNSMERIRELAIKTDISVTFTSAQAVSMVDKTLNGDINLIPLWKIFCLSGNTRETIANSRSLSKSIVAATAENAAGLAKKIMEKGIERLVFFCGDKRRDDLPELLSAAGIQLEEIVVYRTIETPVLETGHVDGVLFFSPSAVQSFFSVNKLNKDTVCFAIGETTATAIGKYTVNRIITSEFPRQELLVATAGFYFQQRDLMNNTTE